jgi:glycosyltransferase involved in cell wall biosynthesis
MFLGNRADVEKIYSALDIVALTSLNEGTPLSLIEGMAARRPVISTIVGGVRDLLGDATEEIEGFKVCERGIGIADRSVSGYTKGLLYLAENGRLRKSLAEKGRAFVEAEYSKDRLVDDIAKVYRSLTERI